jgi:hypothetical protein
MNPLHLARARDPLTSHMAAQRSHKFAHGHKDRIVRAMLAAGHGANCTAAEIATSSGLTVVQVDRRLPELRVDRRVRVAQYGDGSDVIRGGYRCWVLV